jgi:hypothetical protein
MSRFLILQEIINSEHVKNWDLVLIKYRDIMVQLETQFAKTPNNDLWKQMQDLEMLIAGAKQQKDSTIEQLKKEIGL